MSPNAEEDEQVADAACAVEVREAHDGSTVDACSRARSPRSKQLAEIEYTHAAVAGQIGWAVVAIKANSPRTKQLEQIEHIDSTTVIEISRTRLCRLRSEKIRPDQE